MTARQSWSCNRPMSTCSTTQVQRRRHLNGGFKVDLQAMDYALVARRAKDKPADGGWNVFMTSWTGRYPKPILAAGFNAGGAEKGWFGWPDDAKMEPCDQFANDPANKRPLPRRFRCRRWRS